MVLRSRGEELGVFFPFSAEGAGGGFEAPAFVAVAYVVFVEGVAEVAGGEDIHPDMMPVFGDETSFLQELV